MKNKFQIFINICFFTLLFLLILNILISVTWKYYNNFKYSKNNPFPEIVRSNFELNDKDQSILHINTHKMKYYYKSFVGPLPDNFVSEYVNFNKSSGRKTYNNYTNCEKNIVFFGGSTTFGWLSTDEKTIPSFFSKNLATENKNYCVFNFGSPWFYSKQENNYLIDLIERNTIKPDIAIFIDGVNERCNGFVYDKNLREQFDEIIVDHRTEIAMKKFLPFVTSLPIYQLLDRVFEKKHSQMMVLSENTNCSKKELKNLFQSRLEMRLKICKNYQIECVSFLQPFGGVNGKTYPVSKKFKNQHVKLLEVFKDLPDNLILDISSALNNDKNKYSYVDALHYSHFANDLISKEIIYNLKLLKKIYN